MGDYTKGMLALGGTHLVGSTLGGVFQGQAASKAAEIQRQQMELEKRKAEQDEAQRQLINANNRYAPRISYGPQTGMIRSA